METIDHLLVSSLHKVLLVYLSPVIGASGSLLTAEVSFLEWWRRAATSVPNNLQKGLNTLIILGAWTMWKHRNECLQRSFPLLSTTLSWPGGEIWNWGVAGAKGLSSLNVPGEEVE